MKITDEKYMMRCLQLAEKGRGHASPNPMVGAVIVCENKIIGEGFHRKCGQAHAEVNAINAVKDKSLLPNSTIYVSLEPCSHYGKTPPCAQLLIDSEVKRVVIACLDPYPEVRGRGVKMLKDAGIIVEVGVLEAEALALNKAFIMSHTRSRPYIMLKWAESIDGFIDKIRLDSDQCAAKISSSEHMVYNHKVRTTVDAILVGTNTSVLDNPSLSVRNWHGKSPLRVCVDRKLRTPKSHHIFDGSQPTLIFTEKVVRDDKKVCYIQLDFSCDILEKILKHLYERNINLLLVEGGSRLLDSFIRENLWDEATRELSEVTLHNGVIAPCINEYIGKNTTVAKSQIGSSVSIKYYNNQYL